MKIVSVMTTDSSGGAEFAALEMLEALRQRGNDTVMLTDMAGIGRTRRGSQGVGETHASHPGIRVQAVAGADRIIGRHRMCRGAFVGGRRDGGLQHKVDQSHAGASPCTWVQQVGVGLDFGLPLIKTTARDQCDITDTSAGGWLTVEGWVLQVLAWAFATLFVAGFTSAVRKT